MIIWSPIIISFFITYTSLSSSLETYSSRVSIKTWLGPSLWWVPCSILCPLALPDKAIGLWVSDRMMVGFFWPTTFVLYCLLVCTFCVFSMFIFIVYLDAAFALLLCCRAATMVLLMGSGLAVKNSFCLPEKENFFLDILFHRMPCYARTAIFMQRPTLWFFLWAFR